MMTSSICAKLSSAVVDVSTWLKSLRLHKYSPLFQQMTYDEMMNLTDEWLESRVSRLWMIVSLTITACSHRRHAQDKSVLCCLCRWCEHNCTWDKTGLSCLGPVSNFQVFNNPQYIQDWTVTNWKLGRDKTKLSCLVANYVHTPKTRTRQDKTVYLVSTQFRWVFVSSRPSFQFPSFQ